MPKRVMELILDVYECEVEVIQDAEGERLKLRLLLTRANVKNKNRRVYPRQVLVDMVERGKKKLAAEGAVTMLWKHPPARRDGRGRPIGFDEDHSLAVSLITDVYMRGDKVYVDTEFLNTPFGNSLAEQYRAGKRLFVSLRSLGNSVIGTHAGEKVVIAEYLDWFGGDWVPDPALPEAGPEEVLTDSEIETALDSAKEADPVDPELLALLSGISTSIATLQASLPTPTPGVVTDSTAPALAAMQAQLEEIRTRSEAGGNTQAITDQIAALAGTVNSLAEKNKAAEEEAKKVEARKGVQTFVDSLAANTNLERFGKDGIKLIQDRVARAETPEAAQQILTDACQDMDNAIAAGKLAALGYRNPAAGAGSQRDAVVEVTGNPRPYMEIIDKMDEAFRDYSKLSNFPSTNPSLRVANKAFADDMLAQMEKSHYGRMCDDVETLKGGNGVITDATNNANLWNMPTIHTALMLQQFWVMEALQFCQGIGPNGFDHTAGASGSIGSVLKVPVEYFIAPAGHEDLPNYMQLMRVGEGKGIPEFGLATTFLTFAPDWMRAAFRLTADAEKELQNGPLNYNAYARLMFHLTQHKARNVDYMLYEAMLQVAAEYGAVSVANEAVAAAASEWTYNAGGSTVQDGITYGTGVVGVAQLLCGGVTTAPRKKIPLVRPRVIKDLTSSGQRTSSTKNALTIANIGGTVQVEGYLSTTGQIVKFPLTTPEPTYAVDWYNGKVVFNAASGVAAATRPTFTKYTYETNFDTFNLSTPVLATGETEQMYYNKLLQQLDFTAANMGSFDKFVPPDTAIMSLTLATYIQNATLFYQWASPPGSQLVETAIKSSARFAERSGIEYAKIQTPWSAGDRRILLNKRGTTKYGVDSPFEIQGPFPSYDSTGAIIDEKIGYGRENSVVCTPQVEDQNGKVLNPVARTLLIR